MSFATSIGKLGCPEELTGRLSTGLGCWPRSFTYLGYRAGPSEKHATAFVFVCVSDAMVVSYDAIQFVVAKTVVTSLKIRSKVNHKHDGVA